MYCRKCGKEIKDDTKFCPYCGTPVNAISQQAMKAQPRSDTSAQNRIRYNVPNSDSPSGANVKIRTAFVYPLLGVFAYYLCAVILDIVLPMDEDSSDYVLISAGLDVAFTVVLTILFFMEQKRTGSYKTYHPLKLSVFGWLCLAALFFMIYWTSEYVGNFLLMTVEDTNAYVTLEGSGLLIYDIMAISIGPVFEELAYRWMCYHSFRKRWSFWPSVILSTFLFTVAHGTLMHIPVTVALSLFICILYEVTGQFRWCIIAHILFNLAGDIIIFRLSIDAVPMIILWVLTIVFMIFLWQFRDFFFNKVFTRGNSCGM